MVDFFQKSLSEVFGRSKLHKKESRFFLLKKVIAISGKFSSTVLVMSNI